MTITTDSLFRSSTKVANPTYWLVGLACVFLLGLLLLVFQVLRQLPDANISLQKDNLNQHERHELSNMLGSRVMGNFLQADLQTYVDEISKVDWVEQVDIRRDWQHGLVINVTPRKAVAKFGSERLVDANGVVFRPADESQLDLPYWMQLQGDARDAISMMQQVKQVNDWYLPLGLTLKEVIVTSRMTWLFRFDNGLRILVDNDNTSEKLYRLSVMLQNQLNSKLSKMQSIDLRYKNGMAVTWVNSVNPQDSKNIKK